MAKEVLTTGKVTFGGSQYGVTDVNYNESYAEVDGTDTATSGDGSETYPGRAARTFSFTLFMDTGASDLTMKTATSMTLDYEGKTYAGTGILLTKDVGGSVDGIPKIAYTGRFNGAVTETPQA